uniref:Uncharacterized protein n=1 Tax=Pararge aegeria TaxID=116150 RepID=S4NXW8_9NEOP
MYVDYKLRVKIEPECTVMHKIDRTKLQWNLDFCAAQFRASTVCTLNLCFSFSLCKFFSVVRTAHLTF